MNYAYYVANDGSFGIIRNPERRTQVVIGSSLAELNAELSSIEKFNTEQDRELHTRLKNEVLRDFFGSKK